MVRSLLNASLIAIIALVLGLSFTQSFAEKPADGEKQPAKQKEEPKKEKAPEKVKAPRVFGDYAKLQLTDDQKAKIAAIHNEILEKRKALEQEEEARSMAVLTDEQKAEITKIRETEALAKKQAQKEKAEKEKSEKDAAKAKADESSKAKTE